MKKARVTLIVVGVASIVMAVIGLLYNLTTVFADYSDFLQEEDITHFYPAFYTMSAICIGCYIALLICGIQFIRLRTTLLALFIGIIVFEVIYFFSISAMWLIPKIGMSIGAATGVANGGLMFQAFILFPLWAPLLAAWATRRLNKSEESSNQSLEATS